MVAVRSRSAADERDRTAPETLRDVARDAVARAPLPETEGLTDAQAVARRRGEGDVAVLDGALLVVFAAVLFVPALSDYFGLTGPARPVFTTVLPALVLWFGALTAAYRFRVLDRVLGLDRLPATPGEVATVRRAV